MNQDRDVASDLKHILQQLCAGLPVDPTIRERVIARGERARAELAARGVTNFVDDLIREIRDEDCLSRSE
jgi:hypothetical protein